MRAAITRHLCIGFITAGGLAAPATAGTALYTLVDPERTLDVFATLEDIDNNVFVNDADDRENLAMGLFDDEIDAELSSPSGSCSATASQVSTLGGDSIEIDCAVEARLIRTSGAQMVTQADSRFASELTVDEPIVARVQAFLEGVDSGATQLLIWRRTGPGQAETLIDRRDFGAGEPTVTLDEQVRFFPGEHYVVRFFTIASADSFDGFEVIGGAVATLRMDFSACVADFDNDASVGASDLAELLAAWGGPGADLNGDGVTDATDLAVLLAAWGGCP